MVLAAYNRKKILPRHPVNLKLYRKNFFCHFWKQEKFLKIEQSILHIYAAGQKFPRNRSISHGLGDTSNFKFYHFCHKFENSKWPPFLERGNFFGIEQSISQRYHVGQKFLRNRSISHVLEVIKEFVFSSLIKILMLN